jgi:hypothetical protein
MITEQKLHYIESCRKLVVNAETYESAVAHSNFTRGVLAAWNADMTITLDTFRSVTADLDTIMAVKRQAPKINEGVGF